jgi:hypothetical protein
MVDRGNGKANGASKPNGNGKAFTTNATEKRIEAESKLVRAYMASGKSMLDSMRMVARHVVPDPFKPGSRVNGQ